MSFFDNLFRVDTKNEYLVTGLSRELNSIYVYDHFKKNNNNILLVTILYMKLMICIIELVIILIKYYFFLWMILCLVRFLL